MTAHKTRGLKRTCQNEDCALLFYDLNREQFDCPNCGEPFDPINSAEAPTLIDGSGAGAAVPATKARTSANGF